MNISCISTMTFFFLLFPACERSDEVVPESFVQWVDSSSSTGLRKSNNRSTKRSNMSGLEVVLAAVVSSSSKTTRLCCFFLLIFFSDLDSLAGLCFFKADRRLSPCSLTSPPLEAREDSLVSTVLSSSGSCSSLSSSSSSSSNPANRTLAALLVTSGVESVNSLTSCGESS